MLATGATLREVPMTMTRSTTERSRLILRWNSSERSSPKNVMSGFITPGPSEEEESLSSE